MATSPNTSNVSKVSFRLVHLQGLGSLVWVLEWGVAGWGRRVMATHLFPGGDGRGGGVGLGAWGGDWGPGDGYGGVPVPGHVVDLPRQDGQVFGQVVAEPEEPDTHSYRLTLS